MGKASPGANGLSLSEAERNKTLLKQTRGLGILPLMAAYFAETALLIVLFGSGAISDSGRTPWILCLVLVFVLGAQHTAEMRVNKRIDALVSLLVRKRVFDDEVTETRFTVDVGGTRG